MSQAKFGKNPSGKRLELISKSPNFKNGQFQNLSYTPSLTKGANIFSVYYEFLFKKAEDKFPSKTISTIKTDIKSLDVNQDVFIWLGHSSYYFQLNGKRFLVDPVFSNNISPVGNTAKAFNYSYNYTTEDFPQIDYLLITHDHYDHLDYPTIKKLNPKVNQVICPLGVGSHLEYWKYDSKKIIEKDWFDEIELNDSLKITLTPARHFSGRTLKRNATLWTSYVIETPLYKMYLGGDSGYDTHFKKIGEQFGPFDFSVIENGQYNKNWEYIHTLPEQTLQAAIDLNTKRFIPVHSAKFSLAHHSWFAPLETITDLVKDSKQNMITPQIGEIVNLKNTDQKFEFWWKNQIK